LCGHSFSASSISAINQRLDANLAQFAGRPPKAKKIITAGQEGSLASGMINQASKRHVIETMDEFALVLIIS
jgi:hypothetical protein